MTRNTGWGSSSTPRPPSRSSGWSQDNLTDKKPASAQPALPGVETSQKLEEALIEKHRPTLVENFGEDFKNDPRYALALAQVLEGKRAVHMILADYRPRERTSRGGGGW